MNGFFDILMEYKRIKETADDLNKSNSDDVSSMSYYDGNLKPIDAMLQQFGKQAVMSWCLLNAFKYLWRCEKKHSTPTEDIKKAIWYLNEYIELKDHE